MLSLLSPESLQELRITATLVEERELQLARFTRLTSLTMHTHHGGTGDYAFVRQLPRLQHLALQDIAMDEQLVADLLPLTGLTRLVSVPGIRCR